MRCRRKPRSQCFVVKGTAEPKVKHSKPSVAYRLHRRDTTSEMATTSRRHRYHVALLVKSAAWCHGVCRKCFLSLEDDDRIIPRTRHKQTIAPIVWCHRFIGTTSERALSWSYHISSLEEWVNGTRNAQICVAGTMWGSIAEIIKGVSARSPNRCLLCRGHQEITHQNHGSQLRNSCRNPSFNTEFTRGG